ncbi:MAG: hypothetical protein QM756_12490 [Polyangiaceae bacterium]
MSFRRLLWRGLVVLGFGLLALGGCSKKQDVVVASGEGKALPAAAIDADPLALLPANAVGVFTIDARALVASPFGARLVAIAKARSPLPASSGFDPGRDLERVYGGLYSMQGADSVGVAVGTFKPELIEKAALEAQANTGSTSNVPITRSEYAHHVLYTSRGMGFSVLTERSLLVGDETGIRRALDRIQEGRVRRQLPKWMIKTLETKDAPLAFSADLTSQPLPAAAREQLAFVDGLRTANLLGNFADPGLNLVGTLTYAEPEAAKRGADNLKQLHGQLSSYGPIMALLGIPQPVRTLSAQAEEKEVRFAAGVDGAAIAVLLEKAESYLSTLAPARAGGS